MVSIPDSVFIKYKNFADDFISKNFGVNCKLIYPPRRIACVNCITANSLVGSTSTNKYKHGGPQPFSFGNCPTCGGAGFKEDEQTETIKMRVYFRAEEFIEIVPGVNTADSDAQVIGFIYDLPKYERANEIILNVDQANYQNWKFSRIGDAVPHGFKKDRYFMAFLKRI